MKVVVTPPEGYGAEVVEPISDLAERAYVLAILTYPAADEATKRSRLAVRFNDTFTLGLELGSRSDAENHLPNLGNPRSVLRWDDALSNLKGRLEAGNLAVGLMLDAAGLPVNFPSDLVRVNHLKAMEWAVGRAEGDGEQMPSDGGDAKTFEKRIWRRSIPVIHLAASYAFLMKSNAVRRATFLDLVHDEVLFRDFIKLAEQLRPLGPRIRPGSIRTEALWDVSWIA